MKAERRNVHAVAILPSWAVNLGGTVLIWKYRASSCGPDNDAISPLQPGNSGGALVDERGNVVGVESAKLSARAALASSGALPENVNYAVNSSYLAELPGIRARSSC